MLDSYLVFQVNSCAQNERHQQVESSLPCTASRTGWCVTTTLRERHAPRIYVTLRTKNPAKSGLAATGPNSLAHAGTNEKIIVMCGSTYGLIETRASSASSSSIRFTSGLTKLRTWASVNLGTIYFGQFQSNASTSMIMPRSMLPAPG